jgi:hypothetical protein
MYVFVPAPVMKLGLGAVKRKTELSICINFSAIGGVLFIFF